MEPEEEKALARILTRAAALQEARDEAPVSLDVVEEAAAEVGIDPALVRRAAWEQEPTVAVELSYLGVPTKVVRRRWLDTPFDDHAKERMLARLDAYFGTQGARELHKTSATWTAREIYVSFESEGPGTLVQISERFVNTTRGYSFAALMMSVFVTLMSTAMLFKSLGPGVLWASLAALIAVVAVGGSVFGTRRRLAQLTDHAGNSFDGALDSLESVSARLVRQLEASEDASDSETAALPETTP